MNSKWKKWLALGMLGGAGTPTFASYMASLNHLSWDKTNETSGTNAANSGTLGAAADATIGGTTTLGQTTPIGANTGFLYDGLTSIMTIAANAAINNLTAWTYGVLIKPTNAGESNTGHLFSTPTGITRVFRINNAALALRFFATSDNITADTVTNDGFITAAINQYVFGTFDNAGDRKIHIYKYVSGLLTEATYASQVAMTGTIAVPAGDMILGNRAAQTFTFNGVYSNPFINPGVLSLAQMAQIGALTGLT